MIDDDEKTGFKYFCINCRQKKQNNRSPNHKIENSSQPQFKKVNLDLCTLALQSVENENQDSSDEMDEVGMSKLGTSDSLNESQSSCEKNKQMKGTIGKAQLKMISKMENKDNGKTTPSLKSRGALTVDRGDKMKRNGKSSVVVGKSH